MKLPLALFLFLFYSFALGQVPFYYTFKKVKGTIFQENGQKVEVRFKSRRRLEIRNCTNPDLDTILRTLTLTRTSRKYLEHLVTSSAHTTVHISNQIGLIKYKGKYRLAAGLTGPCNKKEAILIYDSTSNFEPRNKKKHPYWVYSHNTIQVFKGSITYYYDPSIKPDSINTFMYDMDSHRVIKSFAIDTITIEPIMNPDIMYKNFRELFYFAGVHEIFHTTPKNIYIQTLQEDPEYDAYKLERKLFKQRKRVNRKKIRY